MNQAQKMKLVADHITKYPKVNAAAMTEFCQKHNLTVRDFSATMYELLSSLLTEGASKNFQGTYNYAQIDLGVNIEMEHTTCSVIAMKIARDHLSEIPDYYTRLIAMEAEAKVIGDI